MQHVAKGKLNFHTKLFLFVAASGSFSPFGSVIDEKNIKYINTHTMFLKPNETIFFPKWVYFSLKVTYKRNYMMI